MSDSPRILFYDIETFPNVSYTWGKWQQDVIAFKKEWSIASFAYKWLGDTSVRCLARPDFKCETDKELAKALHALFKEADILVAHNGDSFDFKKTQARFLYHGLPPPKLCTTIDTKKVAKKYFSFNSNALNDLAIHLGLGKKIKHPGFSLWEDCMMGCPVAWALMRKYNKHDVVLLEKIYLTMRPWIQGHPTARRNGCPSCGEDACIKRGFKISRAGKRQMWQCQKCAAWHLGKAGA